MLYLHCTLQYLIFSHPVETIKKDDTHTHDNTASLNYLPSLACKKLSHLWLLWVPANSREFVANPFFKQRCSMYEGAIVAVSLVCTAATVQASLQQLLHVASELDSISVLLLWSNYRNFNIQDYIFPNTTSRRLNCHAFSALYHLSSWRSHWLK